MQQEPQKMFFVIADISGYTKFMMTSRLEIAHLQGIISDLLHVIIEQIEIPLQIAKFEGDAIFMYAAKNDEHDWQSVTEMLGSKFFAFIEAFDKKLQHLASINHCNCKACVNMSKLKLKVLAHYGEALTYQIGGHTELSGLDVIIVHRLLKNHVPVDKYVLLSGIAQEQLKIAKDWHKAVESYPDDVGNIDVYWQALESPEIAVQTNPFNLLDLPVKLKYNFMRTFNLFKNKDGLKNISAN